MNDHDALVARVAVLEGMVKAANKLAIERGARIAELEEQYNLDSQSLVEQRDRIGDLETQLRIAHEPKL
jgi:hypothetical protein